ncbi:MULTISPECIES: tetratricopeptide repeat-containing sulfotransferase family protein [unclassified Mesorhizobium]|uniref:tetratricopeptide repeat-containing sulfotransferase family protein n=1 Tax=unclassified Mesorhizobium TaxID=325217 RepID=UPI001CCAD56D|nr:MULTISPECIES: tetratricopeptide repeat-containing sulfotransferase family protein [unclassified Mesorhizobium]MBZ9681582.1 sulfotransferase [Mesorhizobium sp. CO1-1-2]MBZ9927467.1 sulfotransferase [Mesorhizobium sp. BR1-1-4]
MNNRLPPAWSKHLKTPSGPKNPQSKIAEPKAGSLSHAQADDALLRRAVELHRANRLPEAEALCQRVLAHAPRHPLALYLLGTFALGLDDEMAIRCFERAVKEAPQNPHYHLTLGETYLKVGEHTDAIRHFERACELKADWVEALCALGRAYTGFGKADLAVPLYEKALKIDDGRSAIRIGLANALVSLGRMDEAANYMKEAIARGQDVAAAYNGLVGIRKFKEEPTELKSILAELKNPALDNKSIQQLHYAAGKVLNDIRRYDEAMGHFQQAKRSTRGFDLEAYRRGIDFLIELFSPEMLAAKTGHGSSSEVPVFVLGMPRSGTTLTEQICASHPDAYGAGELTKLRRITNSLAPKTRSPEELRSSILTMTVNQSKALAEDYLAHIRQRSPNAQRIVDKLPHNFELIGLIRLLFPKARIIHCRRDAIDNCLSCYFLSFNEDNSYTADLHMLGLYYREYDRLMRHWDKVFPGQILETRYEDMVSDQEAQSRRLIDHLGLPWDDACLRFFDKPGSVNTFSRWQVRQPIYTSSVNRWKGYGSSILPLIEALGDLVET